MKWGLWVTLVATSGALGACGDSVTPSTDESVATSHDALRKGSVGARVGDADFCDDSANKCALGEGDCDSSAQCQPSLTCVAGNLAKRGALNGDACAPSHCGNGYKDADELSIDCGGSCGSDCSIACDKPNGNASRCSTDCPCSVGEGDCDGAAECQSGLVCGTGNGVVFGLPVGTDACWAATCQNGAKDGNETAVDCGGSCAPCAPPAAGPVAVAASGLALLPIVIANHSDQTVHTKVLAMANDLRDKLNAIVQPGGTPFAAPTVSDAPSGISLGIDGDFPNVGWPYQGFFRPNDVLAGGVLRPERLALQEQYVLRTPQGSNRVIVAGATTDALQDAVWDLLKRAGYRHYFQSPTWEVTPYQPSLTLELAVDEKPAFLMRNLTFPGNQWEPAFTAASNTQISDWAKHNRMGGNAALSANIGYGQIVTYWQNRHGTTFPAELSTDPSKNQNNRQFCLTGSKNIGGVTWTVESVVREWALAQTTASISLSPNVNITWASATVNGALNCNDINDPTYSSVANRMAAILNAAADAQPTKPVTATLWYDFTEAPTLSLRQNVFTNIHGYYPTPTTFALENRLKNWSDPAFEVGIDDYFGVSNDETPGQVQLSPQGMVDRVKRFYQLGARRYTADANWGWGMAGPSWWTLSQVLWDADAPRSAADYRSDFLANAFGPAAPALDKFYGVLEGRALWSENLVGVMYRSLQEGFSLADTAATPADKAAIQARLGDLAVYTRYLELNRKFWNRCSTQAGGGSEQTELKEVLQFAYATRDRHILESRDAMYEISNAVSACSNCTTNGCVNAQGQLTGAACVMTGWGVDCPTPTQTAGCGSVYGTATNEVKTGTAPDLAELRISVVGNGVTHTHVLPDGVTHDYSLDLVPFTSDVAENSQLPTRMSEMYTVQPYYLYFQRPTASGALGAHIRKYAAGQTLAGQLSLAANPGVSLGNRIFQGTALETDWTFDVTSPALHRLDLDDRAGRMYTSFPSGTRVAVPAGATDPPLPFNYRWSGYFVVPAGTPRVVGWSQSDGAFSRYTKASGTWQTITGYLSDYAVGAACTSPRIVVDSTRPNALNDHFIIPVVNPPATKDEIWLFHDPTAGAAADRVLLSTPPYLFRSPAEILVPREVAPETTTPTPCSTTAACPTGQYCSQAGFCRTDGGGCTATSQCATAQSCQSGSCQCTSCSASCTCGTGGTCQTNNDCRPGLTCVEHTCQDTSHGGALGDPCNADVSCLSGLSCAAQQCVPSCQVYPNPHACDAKACGDDASNGCNGVCTGFCDNGQAGFHADADCTAGSFCGHGVGARFGFPASASVCWPAACASQSTELSGSAQGCGTPLACVPNCTGNRLEDGCGGYCVELHADQLRGPGGSAFTPVPMIPRDGKFLPDPLPEQQTTEVGTLPGLFEVTEHGTANYTIPIEVPPGRLGVEPNLALKYLGTRANGMVGVGWGLSGLSTITRCRSTRAQPPYDLRPVMLDEADRFCLDGEMLIQVNATGVGYGADGAQYVLEKDTTRMRITSHSLPGLRTDYFTALTRDGRTLTFGKDDAKVIASNEARRVWALSEEEDSAQNVMTVRYKNIRTVGRDGSVQDTGELLPTLISYGGSKSGAASPAARDNTRFVTFKYDERPDPVFHYSAGDIGFSNWRLSTIETWVQNSRVKIYRLAYESLENGLASNQIHTVSKVKSVRECSSNGEPDGELCKPATTFEYFSAGAAYQQTYSIVQPNVSVVSNIVLDADGDGHDDLLLVGDAHASQRKVELIRSNWSNDNPALAQFQAFTNDQIAGDLPQGCFSQDSVVDINNDGRDDLVSLCGNQTSFGLLDVYLSNGSATSPGWLPQHSPISALNADRSLLGDYDGDGLKDLILCHDDGKIEIHKNSGSDFYAQPMDTTVGGPLCSQLFVFDFDGDGDDDLVNPRPAIWRKDFRIWDTIGNTPFLPQLTLLMDINGDGLKDVVSHPMKEGNPGQLASAGINPLMVWFNTGKRLEPRLLEQVDSTGATYNPSLLEPGEVVVMDIDGDGAEDIVAPGMRVGRLIDHTRLQWTDGRTNFPTPNVKGHHAVADLNGDGSLEVVFEGESGALTFAAQGPGIANLLHQVRDGLGRQDDVAYQGDYTHPHANVPQRTYSPDACLGSSGLTCLHRVAPLVSDHLVSQYDPSTQGLKLGQDTYFTYSGAVVEAGGHGWFGFKRRSIEVPDISYTQIDYLAGDYRRAGLPFRTETIRTNGGSTYATAGSRTEVVDYDWALYNVQSPNPDSARFPYLQSKTETTLSDDQLISRTLTLYDPDAFNNVESALTTVLTPTGIVSQTAVTSPRLNDEFGHKLGLLDYLRVQSTRGGESTTRETSFSYDDRGLLTAVTREPGDPSLSTYQKTVLTPNELGVVDSKCVITNEGQVAQRCVSVELDDWSIYPQAVTEVGASLTTEYIYGAEAGQLLSRAEPNGVATEFGYDAFGRLNYVHGPTREGPVAYQAAVPAVTDFPEIKAWGAITVASQFAGEGARFTTYDAFGRTVQTRGIGLDDTAVVSEALYDELGRVQRASLPHAAGSGSQGTRAYSYGSNGQLQIVAEPDGSLTRVETADPVNVASAYAGWFDDDDAVEATVVKLPRGNQKVYVRDYAGNVIRSFDDPNGLGGSELTTRFDFGPFDVLRKVTTPKDVTEVFPDTIGRPERVTATSTGTRVRTFSGFDQVESETDANSDKVTYQYDSVGRLTEELDASDNLIAKWEYDGAAGKGLGRPFRDFRRRSPSSTDGTWVEYGYEDGVRGRPISTTYRVGTSIVSPEAGGDVFRVGVTYAFNAPGLVDTLTYPNNGGAFVVQQTHDTGGHLQKVSRFAQGGEDFWRLSAADEGLRPKDEVFGNGVETIRSYRHLGEADAGCALDPNQSCAPGSLSNIFTTNTNSVVLQNIFLSNDRNGNVRSIHEGSGPGTRLFAYDGHDRLTGEQLSSQGTVSQVKTYLYDAIGNMEYQSGLPLYVYNDDTRRLDSVGDTEYHYDGNGNETERIGPLVAGGYQHLDLNEFEMPWHISQGDGSTHDVLLEYTADEQRIVKRETIAAGEKVTTSIGALYERVSTPSGVEHHYKVYGGPGQVAEIVRHTANEPETISYLHSDYLGSTRLLTDATGGAVESRTFDPYGQEVGAVDWDATNIKKGFTGHSHDDDLGLIDMKGRLYDPTVGRFISADPIVSNPMSALGWDRYAYVENNPLSRIDPSGFSWGFADVGGTEYGVDLGSTGSGGHNPGSRQGQGPSSGPGHAPPSAGPGPGETGHPPGDGMANAGGGPTGPTSGPSGAAGPAMGQPSISNPGDRPIRTPGGPNPNAPTQVGQSNYTQSRGLTVAAVAEAPVALAPILGAALAGVAIGYLTNEVRKNSVNLDTGALIDLTTADPRSLGIFVRLATKNWVVTLPALFEFARGLKRLGPIEAARAAYVLHRITVVGPSPSLRAARLRVTGGIGLADILILGTGDFYRIPTYTTDARAVSAAAAQGVLFDAVILPPLSHTGR